MSGCTGSKRDCGGGPIEGKPTSSHLGKEMRRQGSIAGAGELADENAEGVMVAEGHAEKERVSGGEELSET